jgi:NAD(P)-dependent dehydrogenase (short-subunit alcohol dehydrogenase family)
MPGVIQFVRGQVTTPPMPQVDLAGRTFLVTGANSGLGLEAAKLLIWLNCSTVVVVCRSIEKGEQTRKELQSVSSKSGQKPTIVLLALEMNSFSSVVACAERCKDLPRLDGAILNAGVETSEFSLAEGYETTITVNVISTFLLATLLVPILRDSAQKYKITPNIAIVGSAVHFWANPKELTSPPDGQILKTLSDPKQANMAGRYFLSKLPVILLVKYLASVLARSAERDPAGKPLVVINNVAPGLCNTNLFRTHGAAYRAMTKAIARSGEHGARTLVHGATAGKGTHGQYLSECQVKPYSEFVKSKEGDRTAQRLWDELSDIYESVKPGCTKEL